jgi:DNA repair exonuclease SbcCD ATPase subunit
VRLEDSLTRMRDLESQNSMLEKRIRDQEKDVERANGNLREKLNEIEEWKKKIMVQEMETNKLRNLQKEIETYENKMAILTT